MLRIAEVAVVFRMFTALFILTPGCRAMVRGAQIRRPATV